MEKIMYRFAVLFLACMFFYTPSYGSDHDDGELDLKGRALNLTDLYVFREDSQTANPGDSGNMILIMNLNPRSMPGQEYFFSTRARYEFHLTRNQADQKTVRPTGRDDITFRFSFGAPDAAGKQAINFTAITNNNEYVSNSGMTTPLGNSKAGNITTNQLIANGSTFGVFAGLREDPFFFDVEQFFKVRAQALSTQTFLGFLPSGDAKDFTHNYNVLSIVMRVPINFLQNGDATNTIFDVWETISILK